MLMMLMKVKTGTDSVGINLVGSVFSVGMVPDTSLYLYKLSYRNSHTYESKYLYSAGLSVTVKHWSTLWAYQ